MNSESPSSGTYTPERTAPGLMADGLEDVEGRARYWLAATHAANRDVLDLGCGLGQGAAHLAAAGARSVTAVDRAAEIVDAARASSDRDVTFLAAGADALPFDADSFDLVTCFDVLDGEDEDLEAALAEVSRVLRPDGLLILSARRGPIEGERRAAGAAALLAAVGSRLAHVRAFVERSAAVALIMPEETLGETGPDPRASFGKSFAVAPDGGGTVFFASDAALPDATLVGCASDPIDVQRWSEHFAAQQDVIRRQALALEELDGARRRLLEVTRRLSDSEEAAARLPDLIQRERELSADNAHLTTVLEALQRSPSWRITAPLRRAKQTVLARR